MSWSPLLSPPAGGPRFLAIARAVTDDIRRGRLVPGQRLPGSRALAVQLGVHRNTVLAALAELEAQGWITTQPARGTFVSEALPVATVAPPAARPSRARPEASRGDGTTRAAVPTAADQPGVARHGHPIAPTAADQPGFALRPLPIAPRDMTFAPVRGQLSLAAGIPDPRLFPVDVLARAWRRVVRRGARQLLAYGPPEGHPALRRALADMIRVVRGVPATAAHVLLTRGSQMALDLCARALVRPGERVAVEAFGYRPAWDALRLAGAELVPIPVDGDGLDVAALARAAARRPIRAVYVTPHHQYPTTVTMSAARRLALGALARRHGLIVLEDDYDHEFHYDGHPVAPLAAGDDAGHVVYIGTLSKVLAPGLRLGFVVAPPPVIDHLARWRAAMDRQGDQPMEAAVAELIDDGELERHMRRMRVAYLARRDALLAALHDRLATVVTVSPPRGGISLWAQVAPDVDLAAWVAACQARGVTLAPGARFTFDGHEPGALRLVFAPHTPAELARAVATMAAALPVTSRAASASSSARRAAPSGSAPLRR